MAVLICEDDPLIRFFIATVVGRVGKEALTYPDADAALAALDVCSDAIELLITDVSMPGERDGIEFAALVAQRRPEIPIVVMSGDPGSLARGGELSAVRATLAKPFSLDQLEAVLRLVSPG